MANKTTIAFLPGWGFKASIWQPVADQFINDDVILLDLPDATDIEASLNEINRQLPDDCILIAWSLGGILAADLCLKFPRKYKKLITVASTPKFVAADQWKGIAEADISSFRQKAMSDFSQLMLDFQRLVNGHEREAKIRKQLLLHATASEQRQSLLFYLDYLAKADKRESYHQLTLPVLHIIGDQDYLVPAEIADRIKQQYSKHTTYVIADAGHIPFLSHTDIFMTHLLRFIHHDQ